MKIITILVFCLILSVFAFAQDKAKTNQWRGLILDEATPDQAVEILGKLKTDKENQPYRPLKFNEWFDVKGKTFVFFITKIHRRLKVSKT